MPASVEEKPLEAAKPQRAANAKDPLAGKELKCPYCGWTYTPEQGCFCVRVTHWDGTPIGQSSPNTKDH